MEHGKTKPGLIYDRRSAAIALFLTGFIATLSFRSAFSHAPHHWLVSLDFTSLPSWIVAVVNLGFYVSFLWLGVRFYRAAQDEERIVVAGWCNVFLLGFVQNLVSTPHAAAIQWVKAAGMGAAVLAAAYILWKSPSTTESIPKDVKKRLLVLCVFFAIVLVLGALMYFVPIR